jgi:hypothetical protein
MARQPTPLDFPPGVVKGESALSSKNRYSDALNVRFHRGRAQKWGGWTALPVTSLFAGIARGVWTWGDQSARQIVGVGTSEKLYTLSDSDWLLNDVTPIVATLTATNPISTANGSKTVTLNLTAHGLIIGQYVNIPAVASVGGLNMQGNWKIASVPDVDHVTVTAATAANATATGGGAGIAITVEFAPGAVDTVTGFGWSAGDFGAEGWDTPRSVSSIKFTPRVWSIKNFGRVMLACSDSPIYQWDPTTFPMPRATALATGPTLATGIVVTSDGIAIAYGTNQSGTRNLMEVWNAAQGDYTNWDIAAVAGPNGAPSRVNTLREGTAIVYAEDLGTHVTLFWTNTALYALQYTGSAYVFNTQLVGVNCGLIGPLAAQVVGQTAYWMGPDAFHVFNGSVQAIPNSADISEWVFNRLDNPTKSFSWYNKRYGEVCFAFCSTGSKEPDTWVSYNIGGQFWTNGKVARTAGTHFRGSDSRPILFGADGSVYRHDDGADANGAPLPWSLTIDGVSLPDDSVEMELDGYVADMAKQTQPITVDFTWYDHTPDGPVIEDETTITVARSKGLEDARGAGRDLTVTWSGGTALGDDFRFGIPKLNLFPSGARE